MNRFQYHNYVSSSARLPITVQSRRNMTKATPYSYLLSVVFPPRKRITATASGFYSVLAAISAFRNRKTMQNWRLDGSRRGESSAEARERAFATDSRPAVTMQQWPPDNTPHPKRKNRTQYKQHLIQQSNNKSKKKNFQ